MNRRNFLKMTGIGIAVLSGADVLACPELMLVPHSSGCTPLGFTVPPGATDCHHHIYDKRYPVDPGSKLRPNDATVSDYRMLQRRIGTSRNIIVQPSTYGVDNSLLIDSIKQFGIINCRGIAVVNNKVTDRELHDMDAAGVRGIRFNLSQPGGAATVDMIASLSRRVHELGWHIQVAAKADQIKACEDILSKVPCNIVFDHLGHVENIQHEAFNIISSLMKSGKGWVKISGAYILSKEGAPYYSDRKIVAQSYIKQNKNRVLWGSDWPHPTESQNHKPDDVMLLNLLSLWGGNNILHDILVHNPAELYGFA